MWNRDSVYAGKALMDLCISAINQQMINSLSHNSVYAITQDNRNQLWVATWGGGINRASLNNASSLSFTHLNTKK